jgi:hypothetical protein
VSLKRKETEKCRVRDQFCTGKKVDRCVFCHDETCAACALEQQVDGKARRACHACLRLRGEDARVEQHLILLGGTTRKREQEDWKPIRR